MSGPLFGRSSESAALKSMTDMVADGTREVALIEGMAGIGKTALLYSALEYAEHSGLQVLVGTTDELNRARPFGALTEALGLSPVAEDATRADIGRLLVGHVDEAVNAGSMQPIDLSLRIVDAIVALAEDLCADHPLILALEDLHWADASTIRTLRVMARRLVSSPIGLVATFRPSPSSLDLDRAVEDLMADGARHITLGPLDDEDTVRLAQSIVNAPLGPRLRTQVSRAGGTPLAVVELLEALREGGSINVSDGKADVGELSLPPSLRLTMLRRLTFLPIETLELLKVGAILGSSFSLRDVAAVTKRNVFDLAPMLTEALRAGVVTNMGDRLAFRHDLLREAIYAELSGVRKDLHRQAGQALAEAGNGATQVAEQMALGAERGDTEAVRWLQRAAVEVSPRSAATAVRLLERALDLTIPEAPERQAILREMVRPLLIIGRLSAARVVVGEALALEPDPVASVALKRALATVLVFCGDMNGGRELFELTAQASGSSEEERSVDLSSAAVCLIYVGELERAHAFAEEANTVAKQCGSDLASYLSLGTLCILARLEGFVEPAIRLGASAAEHAASAGSPWGAVYVNPALYQGLACLEGDDLQQAEAFFRYGRDTSQQLSSWHIPWYQMYLSAKNYLAGDWDDAIAEAQAGLTLVGEMEFTPFAAVLFPQGLMAAIWLYRGEVPQATAAMATAEEEFAKSGPQAGFDAMLWAKALLLEAQGHPVEACMVLRNAWGAYDTFGYHLAHRWVGADLVRLEVEHGDRANAEAVAAALNTLAGRSRIPTAEAVALRCQGLVDDDPEALVASVEAYRKGPRPLDRAFACEDAAVALARRGNGDDARAFFLEALDVYEVLGAMRLVDRIDAALRRFGVKRGRRGTRRRPAWGWESLTRTELRVVELIAEGITNKGIGERLFISHRTVESHVAHVFRKLDVASRTELVTATIRRLG